MHLTQQIIDPEWDNVFREDIGAGQRLEEALPRAAELLTALASYRLADLALFEPTPLFETCRPRA